MSKWKIVDGQVFKNLLNYQEGNTLLACQDQDCEQKNFATRMYSIQPCLNICIDMYVFMYVWSCQSWNGEKWKAEIINHFHFLFGGGINRIEYDIKLKRKSRNKSWNSLVLLRILLPLFKISMIKTCVCVCAMCPSSHSFTHDVCTNVHKHESG